MIERMHIFKPRCFFRCNGDRDWIGSLQIIGSDNWVITDSRTNVPPSALAHSCLSFFSLSLHIVLITFDNVCHCLVIRMLSARGRTVIFASVARRMQSSDVKRSAHSVDIHRPSVTVSGCATCSCALPVLECFMRRRLVAALRGSEVTVTKPARGRRNATTVAVPGDRRPFYHPYAMSLKSGTAYQLVRLQGHESHSDSSQLPQHVATEPRLACVLMWYGDVFFAKDVNQRGTFMFWQQSKKQ